MVLDFASWVFAPIDFDENKPILIDVSNTERTFSFKQLKQQVRQLVAGLKAIGVQPGDCVCVNAFNDITYNVLSLGIIGAGAIFTGVNPAYSPHELTHHINMVAAKVIIVEPPMLDKTLVAAELCGIPKSNIFVFDIHEGFVHESLQSWSILLQHGESDFVKCNTPDTTVAAYHTTSGTSGLPKAAMIPHSYFIVQAKRRIESHVDYEVRRLTALPPMHVFATPIVPASLRQGSPTYIMRRYDQGEFIKAIEQHSITETYMAPPLLIGIPKSPLATASAFRSLRQVWFGGAGVTHENQLPLYNLLHADARINPVWGMTEVGWVTTVSWPKKQMNSSVGKPLDGFRVRIVDDDGRTLQNTDSLGEIQILAPHPMLGYLDNPEASREAFTVDNEGRWINSGDIGYVDADGDVFIVDRKKDLIKVRGWQVSPAEVESRIQQHPEVVDVGVIGVSLPNGEGEAVRAYVVRQCDSFITADELKKFASLTLARYKCPEEIVFVENIPRNPTGKILRRLLREKRASTERKSEETVTERDVKQVELNQKELITEDIRASGSSTTTETTHKPTIALSSMVRSTLRRMTRFFLCGARHD